MWVSFAASREPIAAQGRYLNSAKFLSASLVAFAERCHAGTLFEPCRLSKERGRESVQFDLIGRSSPRSAAAQLDANTDARQH